MLKFFASRKTREEQRLVRQCLNTKSDVKLAPMNPAPATAVKLSQAGGHAVMNVLAPKAERAAPEALLLAAKTRKGRGEARAHGGKAKGKS